MTDLYQIIYIYISVVKVYLSKPQLSSLLLLLTLDIAYSSVRIAERSSDISAERNRPGRFFFGMCPIKCWSASRASHSDSLGAQANMIYRVSNV